MLINMTPHEINIFSKESVVYNESTRKYELKDGEVAIATIPPSGSILNARFEEREQGSHQGIPVKSKVVKDIDLTAPDGLSLYAWSQAEVTKDTFIVSFVYASAFEQKYTDDNAYNLSCNGGYNLYRTSLFTVGDTVYKDGKIVGCLCLVAA